MHDASSLNLARLRALSLCEFRCYSLHYCETVRPHESNESEKRSLFCKQLICALICVVEIHFEPRNAN
jgi:hypothetical protein